MEIRIQLNEAIVSVPPKIYILEARDGDAFTILLYHAVYNDGLRFTMKFSNSITRGDFSPDDNIALK